MSHPIGSDAAWDGFSAGQTRTGIAASLVELSLGQAFGQAQIRAREIGAGKVGAAQIGRPEIGSDSDRILQIGLTKIGAIEAGAK